MGVVTRPAALAAVLCLGLLGTACGERAEPTGSAVELYPVTVRSSGQPPVVVRGRAERIAVVAPGPLTTLLQLGARERIVAVPGSAARLAGTAAPVVDRRGRILWDELEARRPDLIVASPLASGEELGRSGQATGAAVYVADETSIRGVERSISDLGLLVGEPLAARRLIGRIEESRQTVEERLAGKRRVTVFVDTGFFTTVSDRSLVGDLIRRAGGRNVAGSTPEPGPFDLRHLAEVDPEVYLATSDSNTSLRALRKDARTRRLSAIREGRFAVIPARLLQPGAHTGAALVTIARLLHPDAFR